MFIGVYNIPNLLTLSSIFLTFMACYFAVQGNLPLSMLLLVGVGFIDSIDGAVAKSMNKGKDQTIKSFGAAMDDGVDLVNYSFGPIFVAFAAGYAAPINWFIYFFFAASLVMRLAHFEVYGKEKKGSGEFFTGMPSTMSVLILPIVFAVVVTVPSPLSELLIPAAFVVMGLLFIVNVQMQDLRTSGIRRLLLAVTTVATIIFWIYRLFAG